MAQSTISNSSDCCSTTNSFHAVWRDWRTASERSQILAWLSPLEPRKHHQEVQKGRVYGIGEWLIQSEEFRGWCGLGGEGEGDYPVLFCYGDPGVGKTYISSLVADELCDQGRGRNTAVGYFYCGVFSTDPHFEPRMGQSAASILGSLLKQMLVRMGRIPDDISLAFHEQKKTIGERRPQLPDLVKMLQIITSSQNIFMCIDALDECVEVQRFKLLSSLNQILERSPYTRIFMTGRSNIRAEVEKRLSQQVVSVSISLTRGDITRFLYSMLDKDETPNVMDEGLEADILEKTPKNISETSLFNSLNIEPVLPDSTIYRKLERLSKITEGFGLGSVYDARIKQIQARDGDKWRLGVAALMWITYAERPLRVDELCCALAVEPGSTNFNADNVPSIATVVGCCQGLVIVGDEASTVRLIDVTLHEYLSSDHEIFFVSEPHSKMAEICLTYLNSQQVKALSATPSGHTHGTPFLEYCSVYWGVHARRGPSAYVTSLALDLLQEYNGHISAKLLLEHEGHLDLLDSHTGFAATFRFTGLHCASFFGIHEVVTAFLETKYCDINDVDFDGNTPLSWAAQNGYSKVVKMLLELQGVEPDKPDKYGNSPFSYAAGEGHEEVVRILFERGKANPDKEGNQGRTPLSFAAGNGREEVVKFLLGLEEVSLNQQDDQGYTPLSYAAWNGHEGVVKMLLMRKGVNLNSSDHCGRVPLSCAAWSGHERVMEILLKREEVNPDEPDDDGRTPLSYAACNGHEGAVKVLLGREGVNPDRPNDQGRTPLSYAAGAGHLGVVKMLLEREEVNSARPDTSGRIPLSHAAGNGHEGVLKILLQRAEICSELQGNFRRTAPLYDAARNGHEGVVKILLDREEVTPNRRDDRGCAPLVQAERYGHKRGIETLNLSEFGDMHARKRVVSPRGPQRVGTLLLYGSD